VGAEQPSFGQRHHPVHAGKFALGADDPFVALVREGGRVGREAVRDHGGARLDVVSQEGAHRLGLRVGDRDHAGAAEALLSLLHGDDDERLLAFLPPAAQPGFLAANVGLVDLDPPLRRSRPGRTQTERSPCSIPQAVS
jgi:hypothetical protein